MVYDIRCAADDTSSERASNASVRGQDGVGPGSYGLGYMGHGGNTRSTIVATRGVNTSDDSVDVAAIEQQGIRKSAKMTVTFEDTARAN